MASKNQRIVNLTANTVLAYEARVARDFFSRLAGLLFSPALQPGEALLLEPCSSIHMWGMKFPLDAVFVDRSWCVVGLVESLSPGQVSRLYPNAYACLELPCGTIADTNTKVGDKVQLSDA